MAAATQATRALTRQNVTFSTIAYDYDPSADRIGLQAAEAIGRPPAQVFKTLMVEVDGKPACVALPSDKTLSMKKVAACFGGKAAAMMAPDKAERLTGFKTGGISPFGQKKSVPTAFDLSASDWPEIVLNGGQRGLMVVLEPALAVTSCAARLHHLTADA